MRNSPSVFARPLIVSSLIALIGAALLNVRTPWMQRILVDGDANASRQARVIYSGVNGGDCTSALNAEATASAQSQPSIPSAQAVIAARNMSTDSTPGSLAKEGAYPVADEAKPEITPAADPAPLRTAREATAMQALDQER